MMTLKEQLKILASDQSSPCVTISINTHRTHPDNEKDAIKLKNLLKEAENRVIAEFGKRQTTSLLDKIENVADAIDVNYNLDSLHVFLSNETQEIVRSSRPVSHEGVYISDSFALRPIIESYTRTDHYLVMLLSQSGVQLYEAVNDSILREIGNEDFPFSENPHYNTYPDKGSDPKHLDDLVREFLNKVDKALVNVYNETGLHCIVVCTEDNFSRLRQVADKPSVYIGYTAIDYNKTESHQIVDQSWDIIESRQKERTSKAIEELREAVAQGRVLTDLQEIFQASADGLGDLLMIHQDFSQAVIMTGDRTFELTDDKTRPNAIDDITSNIAWDVLSKKGRVIFTAQDKIKELGNIVLKTRY